MRSGAETVIEEWIFGAKSRTSSAEVCGTGPGAGCGGRVRAQAENGFAVREIRDLKVEIFTKQGQRFPSKKLCGFKKAPNGAYCAAMSKREAVKALKKAEKLGLRGRYYEEKYDRNTTYRQTFIKKNPPRDGFYQCVYCGRLLRPNDMEVDHVIPVSKAKSSKKAIRLLHKKGVNNPANLVPSCHRCNMRKGTSISLWWRYRAKVGRHRAYWAARMLVILLAVVACMAYCSRLDFSSVQPVLDTAVKTVRSVADGVEETLAATVRQAVTRGNS